MSVQRVLVLIIAQEHEREYGYCSRNMMNKAIDTGAGNNLAWLGVRGFICKTGVWARPRRLTAAGLRVCASFAAHFERLMREERERAKPKKKRAARASRVNAVKAPFSLDGEEERC